MPEAPALRDVQAWMLAVMTEPGGAQSEAARERIDATPEEVVRSTPGLGAGQRLELYRRGYTARLLETMRAHHPALRHALGDEVFDAFAVDYLAARPSRSYTLLDLGAGFADHLEATRPDGDESWPDFLIDLVRLERAFIEVYDGPGAESAELLQPGDVTAGARLLPVPCLRLLAARFPVADYLMAVRRREEPPLPAPRRTWLALSRRDYEVTITELDERGHALLAALIGGAPVGDDDARRLPLDWAERGFFLSADPTQEAPR
jgi:hypothetical protein